MPTVRFPDGVVREFSQAARVADVVAEVAGPADQGKGKKKPRVIAALLDGKAVGLDAPLPAGGEVAIEFLKAGDPRALPVMRHSAAHVMARAVMRLFDGVELAFGPTVGEGFYYDMRAARPITDEDLPAIEADRRAVQDRRDGPTGPRRARGRGVEGIGDAAGGIALADGAVGKAHGDHGARGRGRGFWGRFRSVAAPSIGRQAEPAVSRPRPPVA